MTDTRKELAIQHKDKLSKGAYRLLNNIILDLQSKLPAHVERVYETKQHPSIIWNLFNGDYKFSYNEYKEILNALSKQE